MNTKEKALQALNNNKHWGVTRRQLTWEMFNDWNLDLDRKARAALAALQRDGHDVISHNGRYYLLTADTPQAAVDEYTSVQDTAAYTSLHRNAMIRKRYQEMKNGVLL